MLPDSMRLADYEFVVEDSWFRYVHNGYEGFGWDFCVAATCVNDDADRPVFLDGILLSAEAAPIPIKKSHDYCGVEIQFNETFLHSPLLPFSFYESGDSLFELRSESRFQAWGINIKFMMKMEGRYLLKLTGYAGVVSNLDKFEIIAWTEQLPDEATVKRFWDRRPRCAGASSFVTRVARPTIQSG